MTAIRTTRSTPTPEKRRAPAEFSPNHPINPNAQPKILVMRRKIASEMPERRKHRLSAQSFHDLNEVRSTFMDWFDIDVCAGMKDDECRVVELMFHRRHVYEHNGGEVDQRYLDKSGDTTVRLKQHIHETQQGAYDLASSLVKMARSVHSTFHELFPPIPEPIKAFADKKARIAKYASRGT